MEEVTSLIINRRSANYWVYTFNEEPETRDAVAYTGTRQGDYLTIASRVGAPQVYRAYYGVVQYIDDNNPENNLLSPSSGEALQQHLINQGFYPSGSGEPAPATLFTNLGDTFGSLAGRGGQVLFVNNNELTIGSRADTAPRVQDLLNWVDGDLQPNQAIITSSLTISGVSIGVRQAPLYNLVNRPMQYNEEGVIIKGYSGFDGVTGMPIWNIEEYGKEIGDICLIWRTPEEPNEDGNFVPKLSFAQWLGGTDYDFSLGQAFNEFIP